MNNNNLEKAESEYRKALEAGGDDASILNGLGHIALTKKRYGEAAQYFDRCLSMDKMYPGARFGKGVVYFRVGSLQEAEEIFASLKIDTPDDPGIYWYLARIAEGRGDITKAMAGYKDAVMHGGDGPLVHIILFRLYMVRGFYYRAFEELRRSFNMIRLH